ncbi:MAG: stage III sporulation protein AF [Clostridium sp.]|uniref:stage III sporulation protein AF n=1 Tax=Clostridium sp. TaxID=1506 RepID=UPI003EE7C972
MEIIKEFVVTLVSTLILITAVELILPDNSMKKYSKFILGAMLIGVILTPIIKFLTHGEDAISKAIISYENKDIKEKENRHQIDEIKRKSFEENLSKNINSMLEKEFDEYSFSNEIKCKINFENMEFDIENIIVYVKGGKGVQKVKNVEKVTIGENKKIETDKQYEKIRIYVAEELNIDKEKVKVVEEEV